MSEMAAILEYLFCIFLKKGFGCEFEPGFLKTSISMVYKFWNIL